MNDSTFMPVTLVPNHQGGSAYESRRVIVNLSVIWVVNKRAANDFEIILNPQTLDLLQKKYYGANTTIKEVIATANDFKGFAIG